MHELDVPLSVLHHCRGTSGCLLIWIWYRLRCQVHTWRRSRTLWWLRCGRPDMISCARVQLEQGTRELINERTYCAPSDLSVLAVKLRTQYGSRKFTWQTQRHYCVIWWLSSQIKCITFMKCVGRTWIQIYWYICHASLPFPLGNVSSNGHTLTHQFLGGQFFGMELTLYGCRQEHLHCEICSQVPVSIPRIPLMKSPCQKPI